MLVFLILSHLLHVYHAGRGPVVHCWGEYTGCLLKFWQLSLHRYTYLRYSSLASMSHREELADVRQYVGELLGPLLLHSDTALRILSHPTCISTGVDLTTVS